MTDTVVYHDSNGNTVSMATENLTEDYDFHNKSVKAKTNQTSVVVDTNRVLRIFSWTALVSRADKDELKGYFAPASAPTYDANFPKIVVTWDGATTENVIGMIIGCQFSMAADAQFWANLTFRSRWS